MAFLGLIETIARTREVKVFMLGNAVSEVNPYFMFFDLTLPYNNDIKLFKDNTILVQYMQNKEFQKEREETLIGKMMKNTKYFDYAVKNKILDKNNLFIQKKTGNAKFSFALIYQFRYDRLLCFLERQFLNFIILLINLSFFLLLM